MHATDSAVGRWKGSCNPAALSKRTLEVCAKVGCMGATQTRARAEEAVKEQAPVSHLDSGPNASNHSAAASSGSEALSHAEPVAPAGTTAMPSTSGMGGVIDWASIKVSPLPG
jgi:hypothetical protein